MNAPLAGEVSLFAATVTSGMAAGVFALYAHTIMPGLRSTDDRTFVTAFQAIDASIVNPWFIGATFLGTAASSIAAAIANRESHSFRFIITALALYLLTMLITFVVHVPLNDAIKAAGNPSRIDVSAVRYAFHEQGWVAWNLVRVVTSLGTFTLIAWASLRHHIVNS